MTRVRLLAGRLAFRLRAEDRGNAMVEFTVLGLLLLIPLVYVVLTVFVVQKAAYAVTAATREAGRAYVTAGAGGDAAARAEAAAAIALGDHGLGLGAGQLAVECSANPCLTPGATVRVRLELTVPLPLLPRVFAGRAPASVAVNGQHEQLVDVFRASRS